jgi:hypothetical protein
MTVLCLACPKNCQALGTNISGINIEEFHLSDGWKSVSETPYESYCSAKRALDAIPKDNIERRVYPAFKLKVA